MSGLFISVPLVLFVGWGGGVAIRSCIVNPRRDGRMYRMTRWMDDRP